MTPGTGALVVISAAALAAGVSVGQAAPIKTSCTPIEVGLKDKEVFVRCSGEVGGGISYFGHSTSPDAPAAARILTVLSTALVAGRTLVIFYEPNDTSGDGIGCQASNCRLITGVSFTDK
jgi:hypothetical protein